MRLYPKCIYIFCTDVCFLTHSELSRNYVVFKYCPFSDVGSVDMCSARLLLDIFTKFVSMERYVYQFYF